MDITCWLAMTNIKKQSLRIFICAVLGIAIYYFYPESKLPAGKKIEKLVVIKSEHVMHVYSNGQVIKSYTVSIGQNPVGDKVYEGDKRTPEGRYKITGKNGNSAFYKNLAISYPDKNDMAEAKKRNISPGGEIKVHGLKNGLGFIGKFHRWRDWTAGCIALTNSEMDEL
jgi:murein L,D-transpeptidase YafK